MERSTITISDMCHFSDVEQYILYLPENTAV